jgi:hypothetical protein
MEIKFDHEGEKSGHHSNLKYINSHLTSPLIFIANQNFSFWNIVFQNNQGYFNEAKLSELQWQVE